MNLAFGGPDNARLFITESQTGSILQADLSVAVGGLPFRKQIAVSRSSLFSLFFAAKYQPSR
jgi:sugar lactone lactonase YvrE